MGLARPLETLLPLDRRELVGEAGRIDPPQLLEEGHDGDPDRIRGAEQVGGGRPGPGRSGRVEQRSDIALITAHREAELAHRAAGSFDDRPEGGPEGLLARAPTTGRWRIS